MDLLDEGRLFALKMRGLEHIKGKKELEELLNTFTSLAAALGID